MIKGLLLIITISGIASAQYKYPYQGMIDELPQLRAAREVIEQTLASVQKRVRELPVEPLRRLEGELTTELAELDNQIARLEKDKTKALTIERPAYEPKPPTVSAAGEKPRRELTLSVDTKVGFDNESVIIPTEDESGGTVPVPVDIKRIISSTVVTGEYPLTAKTNAILVWPIIYQTARVSALGQTLSKSGRGIGDLTLLVERRFPEIVKGTQLSVSAGMQFPTGRAPFNLNERELPTGIGFYQPRFLVNIQKLLVPVQIYGMGEYGTSFSRKHEGQSLKLRNSYGGEIGFFYMIGPEFTSQTALSLRKANSPVLLGPNRSEGYLSQSLTYRTGKGNSFRVSADVGLTRDSIDFWLGLTFRRTF